jgi:hypothetical protein
MALLQQDLYVVLQLAAWPDEEATTYSALAGRVHLSPSRVHAGVQRAIAAELLDSERRVRSRALIDFLCHGVRHAFFADRGAITRGMPTAHAAPPLVELISDSGPTPVWPDPDGSARGESIEPLHPSVPRAAREQPELYELLALVDAMRIGRARERKLAMEQLEQRLRP